ncbi:hypothetical protein AQUCO_04000012v1 [Aquilegia coerulea]|uniref:Uncharacterized protein n=1 Tax=Aquilegia coerulea TaxID=218851 RepID=A0A2G5CQR6_AQUCA|nr:hypothetical protein AQUCO_04000012v1 [Aquilegia coerulea]
MGGGGGGGVDWSEIPEDILLSVVNRLHTVTDYFHLSEVCKPWRTINTCSPHNYLIPQPPFLMLAEPKMKMEEKEGHDAAIHRAIGRRGFVVLNNKDKMSELDLPELYERRCVGSTGNWLITVNKEQEVHILNPFTRTQFQLPSQSTLPNQLVGDFTQEDLRDCFLRRAILCCPPKSTDLNFELDSVVAITAYGASRKLAIARLGDESWTPIKNTIPADFCVDDVIFFKDRFYFVNRDGMVAYYDISCSPLVATHVSGEFITDRYVNKYYLVEWLGELLLVLKYCLIKEEEPYYKTQEFQVCKFNFDNEKWEDVKSLGRHALFLGFNTSVSLLASDSSTFRGDCIYFTDDNISEYIGNGIEGGNDMGVYDLDDGTIKPYYAGISTSLYSPPLWIIPNSLHQ